VTKDKSPSTRETLKRRSTSSRIIGQPLSQEERDRIQKGKVDLVILEPLYRGIESRNKGALNQRKEVADHREKDLKSGALTEGIALKGEDKRLASAPSKTKRVPSFGRSASPEEIEASRKRRKRRMAIRRTPLGVIPIVERTTKRYGPNTIGANFVVALTVLVDSNDKKWYGIEYQADCAVLTSLRLAKPDKLILEPTFKASVLLRKIGETAEDFDQRQLEGQVCWQKNSCVIETTSFKTALEFDLECDEIVRITYAPIGEERRERQWDFVGQPYKRRAYRKRHQLDDPKQPPSAEANRPDALFQARVGKKLAKIVEEFAASSGLTKKEVAERALTLLLEAEGIKLER
jgi:hypothetical protein